MLRFDLGKGTYSVTDCATRDIVLANAGVGAVWDASDRLCVESQAAVSDSFGKGRRIILRMDSPGYYEPTHYQTEIHGFSRLFSFTLYEGRSALILGFGMKTKPGYTLRLKEAYPLSRGQVFPGKKLESPLTLNSAAGAELSIVKPGLTRLSANGLMLTGLLDGKRRTLVWGGLGYAEFGVGRGLKCLSVSVTLEELVVGRGLKCLSVAVGVGRGLKCLSVTSTENSRFSERSSYQ
jgi:hypothetical protein